MCEDVEICICSESEKSSLLTHPSQAKGGVPLISYTVVIVSSNAESGINDSLLLFCTLKSN